MNVTIMTGSSKTIRREAIMVEYRELIAHSRLEQQGLYPYGARANDVRYRAGKRFNKITSIMNLAIGLPAILTPTVNMFRSRSLRQWEPLTKTQITALDYIQPVIDLERHYVH